MKNIFFLFGFSVIMLGLTACGQKGDLYLPQDPQVKENISAQEGEED